MRFVGASWFASAFIFFTIQTVEATTVRGYGLVPAPFFCAHNNVTVDALINSTNDEAAMIFQVPKTGIISQVGVLTTTVTSASTLTIRLEAVDTATGLPSGTLCGTNTTGTQSLAASDDNTWFTVTLTAGCDVTVGDPLAIVYTTTDASSNFSMAFLMGGQTQLSYFPYGTNEQNGGGHVKNVTGLPLALPIYNDGSIEETGMVPLQSASRISFHSGSSPDERGITLEFDMDVSAIGAWVSNPWADPAVGGDLDVRLYDSDHTTVLEQISFDKDLIASDLDDEKVLIAYFSQSRTLLADTEYLLSVRPTTTTAVELPQNVVEVDTYLNVMSGGQAMHLMTRTDTGDWGETFTIRPCLGLLLDNS